MALNLRGTNFVSEIKAISVIQATIKQLLGGDKYYFSTNIKGVARVFYIEVVEYEDGTNDFIFKRDFTAFYYNTDLYMPAKEDEIIKVLTNGAKIGDYPIEAVSFEADPAGAMADYVTVYLDALQTA